MCGHVWRQLRWHEPAAPGDVVPNDVVCSSAHSDALLTDGDAELRDLMAFYRGDLTLVHAFVPLSSDALNTTLEVQPLLCILLVTRARGHHPLLCTMARLLRGHSNSLLPGRSQEACRSHCVPHWFEHARKNARNIRQHPDPHVCQPDKGALRLACACAQR